jgi:hypothetical protein
MEFWESYLHKRKLTAVPFCRGIIRNNQTGIKDALAYMERHKKEYIPTRTFMHLGNKTECDRFRKASGYVSKPLSEKEATFPLAYSIVMYKDVEQAERLLRAIYMPQNYYCIHVDKKAPQEIHNSMTKITGCFTNVFIASSLDDIRWGIITMLKADINCMADLLRFKDWRYFINLTGQEFPLVSNRELVDDFTKLNNTNMISSSVEK